MWGVSRARPREARELRGVERLRGVGMPWDDLLGLLTQLAAALGIRLLEPPDA